MATPEPSRFAASTAFQQALAAMRNEAHLKSPMYGIEQKRALREGAHPMILEFERKLVKRLASLGVPVYARCVVRTADEQRMLVKQGYSKDSPDDGLWPHMAFAVDIIHSRLAYMDRPVIPNGWAIIGHLGKEVAASMGIKITWGGDWKFYDPSHFELTEWRKIARAGDKHWSPKPITL